MAEIRIAMVGKSGAGKSEIRKYLVEKHGFSAIQTGLICREIARILFGNENKSSTQRLDDALTAIDPSIFLRASLRNAHLTGNIVLDAIRFFEDLRLAQSLRFLTVRVSSEPELRVQRLMARGQSFNLAVEGLHRSETELDLYQVDFEIQNTGSVSDLRGAIDSILHDLR
jgi:dephospho-CoA kinase